MATDDRVTTAAARVAAFLGVPHQVVDLDDLFEGRVVGPFCNAYLRGITPNPCIACNRELKYGALLRHALDHGADFFATGHYARVRFDPEHRRYVLLRARDPHKEQSYVLFHLDQERLSRLLLPLGELTKEEVRHKARAAKIPFTPGESQEICFIPEDDYRSFIRKRYGDRIRKGPFLDHRGNVLGQHRGIPFYTIGQRRGLGLALGQPVFVLGFDRKRNAVIVGPDEQLWRTDLHAVKVNYILDRPKDGTLIEAQIRYRTKAAPARLHSEGPDTARLRFEKPQRAIAPGQAVVFYRGEYVLGGGTIAAGESED
jgi:tRNA-specific 2-thiouridylase